MTSIAQLRPSHPHRVWAVHHYCTYCLEENEADDRWGFKFTQHLAMRPNCLAEDKIRRAHEE